MAAGGRLPPFAGYIFGCTQATLQECMALSLFGSPPKCQDVVTAIAPGTPLYLFDFGKRELHGEFEAASRGGRDLDRAAFGGRFPCQGDSV
ncbi:unnamed protein product [Ostreobium quekettii]|uniref:DCD domain-containing protein n=1 Tax=Ostreobium quekettii TaxID=121088 RepID=A0A8S1IWV8_9CHLO|nr:unnamed protein product [Ostreobium quekettii]